VFLLDTNIISELRKPRPHGGVVAWAHAHPPEQYNVPSIAIYELQAGAELVRKQNAAKAREIDLWIELIMTTHHVVPFEQQAARTTAWLMQGQPQELFEDAMIAATAIANGLTVATRNTRDFERFNVTLVNPFLFPRS
jgi:hypothetical protein